MQTPTLADSSSESSIEDLLKQNASGCLTQCLVYQLLVISSANIAYTSFTATNLGSLYKGLMKDMFVNFKHLRQTAHTHHPIDDAKGNAKALLTMKEQMGLKIKLK